MKEMLAFLAALLLPADFDEYRRYSRMFKDAVRAVAPEIEDRGIDEIYIDLTRLVETSAAEGAPDPWARARVVAIDIQRAVRDVAGRTSGDVLVFASVGAGMNANALIYRAG